MKRNTRAAIVLLTAGMGVACGPGGPPEQHTRGAGPPAPATSSPAEAKSRPAPPKTAGPSALSFLPVITPPFEEIFLRMSAEKPGIMERQRELLHARYDLSDRPAPGVTMTRGKPVQEGVRVKLPAGTTWADLAAMSPSEIRKKGLWPAGFLPLPHAHHAQGGMVFPHLQIEEIKRQEGRDLTRFDVEFDLPDHILAEFPPPIFLTARKDLGDMSQGKVVTNRNFYELFVGKVTPKDLDGLRMLLTPFPQQQFNFTDDRRSELPSLGVTCLDCHVNGHTNGTFHLSPDQRPQNVRQRIETPTLRGLNQQRLFGSHRALKTVEDFTEFEQRGAYFDSDLPTAIKKGMNILERGGQVANMADFQSMLDFPPAPKLRVSDNKLDPALATAQELRGQEVFFGKGQCANCHAPPIYSDNMMHDLGTERFFEPREISDHLALGDGKIKTFPLRGIKDSPPYLHDGRLLTLEDTVEFFNLVLELKLTPKEKTDLVAFLRVL